jgi:hypothetical protein
LEDFRNVDVVILRREVARVLKSFIELGYFSSQNPLSLSWMSSPNAATAALPAVAPDSELDQFDLCIAYLVDVEARAQRFKRDYPNVRTHEVLLEHLNDIAYVEELFARLQLTPTAATKELCGRAVNERTRRKEKIDNAVTIEKCRERLAEYIEKAKIAGLTIPAAELRS